MSRDFDGANDRIDFGSDASVDAFAQHTIAFHVQRDVQNAIYCFVAKDRAVTGWILFVRSNAGGNVLVYNHDFNTTDGEWTGGSILTAMYHVALTYDNGATANNPVMYVDGVAVTVTRAIAPVGTTNSDAAQSLLIGETGAGGSDLDGRIQCLTYANALWTAEQVNRHRWWGRVGGAVAVHHPLFTTKLANEGTATAAGTATGTTVAGMPRVMRPGCGGW